MMWNWQQDDWPHFRYDENRLKAYEPPYLKGFGQILGAMKYLSLSDQTTLKLELLSSEALKTSEIEGEYLNRSSVQSSLRKQLGLSVDPQRVTLAEQGISELLLNLTSAYAMPLTHQTLFEWHEMIMRGRRDIDPGRYRSFEEPMQIVSGRMLNPRVHFEAPPSSQIHEEMERFITWFNRPTDRGLVKSGIAHLYFESIHPFEDGNGRIGRALSEKILAQGFDDLMFLFLSKTIQRNKKTYYEALEKANKSNEITDWLIYFSEMVLQAQKDTEATISFLIEKTKFFDEFRGKLNSRQEKVLLRMFEEGPDGFLGGINAEKYISLTKATRSTATRDLSDLVNLGALHKAGELRHTRYYFPFCGKLDE